MIVLPSIFKAVDQFTKPMRVMQRSMRGFASQAEIATARANRAFRKLTSPIRAVGRQLGQFGVAFGGAALVAGVVSVTGVFKDFEQANANLASILSDATVPELQALQGEAKRLGATTAFTASEVAGLQTEFAKLGFDPTEIQGATEATLALAAATKTELPQAAAQVGSAIRAFGLNANESARVADVFAASTSKSALDMEKLATGISTVAPVAKTFGFSIEDTTALLGKLSDAGFDASSAATATRNIILNMADSSGKLAKALGRPVNSLDDMIAGMTDLNAKGVDLATMLDLTDKRSVAAFSQFVSGAEGVKELRDALNAAGGTAKEMADKQMDTLQGSLLGLSSAYEGFILAQEDGKGGLATNIRFLIDTSSEMLRLASGTETSTWQLNESQKKIREWAEFGIKAVKVIGYFAAGLAILKAGIIVTNVALGAYNVIVGLSAGLTGGMTKAIASNTIALNAYKVASGIATAATWAWGAALSIGLWPLTLIVIAIGALIAVTTIIIKKWDEWGAALSLVTGPLGMVISMVQSFRRNWDMIKDSFTNGGLVEGLKAVGKVLLDSVLHPLQQLLEIVSRMPGKIGAVAAAGAEQLKDFRTDMGVNMEDDESRPYSKNLSARAAEQEQLIREVKENKSMSNLEILVKDPLNRTETRQEGPMTGIMVSSTMGM